MFYIVAFWARPTTGFADCLRQGSGTYNQESFPFAASSIGSAVHCGFGGVCHRFAALAEVFIKRLSPFSASSICCAFSAAVTRLLLWSSSRSPNPPDRAARCHHRPEGPRGGSRPSQPVIGWRSSRQFIEIQRRSSRGRACVCLIERPGAEYCTHKGQRWRVF